MRRHCCCCCCDPPRRPKLQITYEDSDMLRSFTATFSAVVPTDNVTERNFHQFDKNGTETVFRLDPSATTFDGNLDDTLAPGSCYLQDLNANGQSEPSPSFALVPPGPGPGPTGVPTTPTVLSVTWTN